jgi:hypothetical protein
MNSKRLARVKAVSMVEIIMTLVVIAGIVTVVARGFQSVASSSTLQNTGTILSAAQVAIRTDGENTSTTLLPDFTVAYLQIGQFTPSNSTDSEMISYNRVSDTRYTLAARYAAGCLILVDNIESREGWLIDASENGKLNCKAPGALTIDSLQYGSSPKTAETVSLP